jgi:UDP-N-acetylenolpyruvoylglucosamine reductase
MLSKNSTTSHVARSEEIRDKARQERGIEMEMEVKIIGEDEATF